MIKRLTPKTTKNSNINLFYFVFDDSDLCYYAFLAGSDSKSGIGTLTPTYWNINQLKLKWNLSTPKERKITPEQMKEVMIRVFSAKVEKK
jgi:hypothetical protein